MPAESIARDSASVDSSRPLTSGTTVADTKISSRGSTKPAAATTVFHPLPPAPAPTATATSAAPATGSISSLRPQVPTLHNPPYTPVAIQHGGPQHLASYYPPSYVGPVHRLLERPRFTLTPTINSRLDLPRSFIPPARSKRISLTFSSSFLSTIRFNKGLFLVINSPLLFIQQSSLAAVSDRQAYRRDLSYRAAYGPVLIIRCISTPRLHQQELGLFQSEGSQWLDPRCTFRTNSLRRQATVSENQSRSVEGMPGSLAHVDSSVKNTVSSDRAAGDGVELDESAKPDDGDADERDVSEQQPQHGQEQQVSPMFPGMSPYYGGQGYQPMYFYAPFPDHPHYMAPFVPQAVQPASAQVAQHRQHAAHHESPCGSSEEQAVDEQDRSTAGANSESKEPVSGVEEGSAAAQSVQNGVVEEPEDQKDGVGGVQGWD
ncbi:hypothetical protein DFJ73DRAFT_961730 [Zopfochytrium polystomum]|nr:hypothetical protein DFJ73DRAFT_961730 [Zopfochytrium polystomum]